MQKLLVIDRFCFRQFEANSSRIQIIYNRNEFEKKINTLITEQGGEKVLKSGYAPFCKHFFVENFTETQNTLLEITPDNEHLLKSNYEKRTENELPVLCRWFEKKDVGHLLKKAKYLDCILYSRDQINLENDAMKEQQQDIDIPWGIISIKPQDVDYELPMNPITQMRNSLGRVEGGSGVPIDRESYLKSVEYWSKYATVR